MATHDYNLANQDGASFRSDLNNALAAIVSNNSSSTSPATTFAHQIWVDTTANVIKQRNAANDAWIELWRIDGGFNAKTFSSNVTLNAQSDLRFADSDSSNWVAFQAPATVASNVTWTLPNADGSPDQALTTNGSGVLSWADAGGVQDNITEGNTSAEVVDTGSDGHFKVVTEGTEALRVNANQRLLYGTTATRAVGTYGAGQAVHIESADGGNWPGLNITWNRSSDAFGPRINFGRSRGSALNSSTVVQSGDELGGIYFYGADGTDLVSGGALIKAEVDGTPGSNDMPGRLVFSTTADGASSPTERMRIDSSGSLLVRATSAVDSTHQLQVGAPAGPVRTTTLGLYGYQTNQGGGSIISQIIFNGGTDAGSGGAKISLVKGSSNQTDTLRFYTGATSLSERIRLEYGGKFQLNMNTFGASVSSSNTGVEFISGSFPVLRIGSGDATSNNVVEFYNTNGQVGRIATSGSGTSYVTSSDYRLKENVVSLTGAADRLSQLQVYRFNFIADPDTTVDGFLAHEAQAVVPEAVIGTHDEVDDEGNPVYQGIDQSKLVPLLTAALQEALAKIETLETRLTALENA